MDSFALALVACGGTAMLALLLSVTKKWRYYFVPGPVLPPEVHHQDGMDFFGPGTYVRLSDPFAIVVCDPEDGRSGTDASRLEVIRILRTKVGR